MTTLITLLRTLGSASRAAAAVEAHRAPRPSDLRRLGIDQAAFGGINAA